LGDAANNINITRMNIVDDYTLRTSINKCRYPNWKITIDTVRLEFVEQFSKKDTVKCAAKININDVN
jgi:hypothetical protein